MFRVCTRLIAILLWLVYAPIKFALAAPENGGCGSRSHPSTASAGSRYRHLPHQSAKGQGTKLDNGRISFAGGG